MKRFKKNEYLFDTKMTQYLDDAAGILEKVSYSRISKLQLNILAILLEYQGNWVNHKSIIESLKRQQVFPDDKSDRVARIQVQEALDALDKKISKYLLREDSQYKSMRLERAYGKGIKLAMRKDEELSAYTFHISIELSKLVDGYKVLGNSVDSLNEVVERTLESLIRNDQRFLAIMRIMKESESETYSKFGGKYLDRLINQ